MSPFATPPVNGVSSNRLLLCVRRSTGRDDEFYVMPGLTIGRSRGNTIVLSDDGEVDPVHAQVTSRPGEPPSVRCLEPSGRIHCGGEAVCELPLDPDVVFHIGRARFQCRAMPDAGASAERMPSSACPYCNRPWDQDQQPLAGPGSYPCPACGLQVLAVPPLTEQHHPLLLRCDYGAFDAEQFVARGGVGIVLKGTHRRSGTPVAIKLVHTEDAAGARFQREVELLQRVRDPHVVCLLGQGRAGPYEYLVMDWMERTLKQVIEQSRATGQQVEFSAAWRWFVHVCRGLSRLHRAGIVHRDVKPSNIHIDGNDRACVADLGAITSLNERAECDLTQTGQWIGTPAYMAPEQSHAPETVDQRTDQYALGVTFYELLTGLRPQGAWRPASTLNPTVPPAFDAVINRLLAPKPEERFERIDEGLRRESGLAGGISPTATPVPRSAIVAAGALLGAAVGVGASLALDLDALPAALVGLLVGAATGAVSGHS